LGKDAAQQRQWQIGFQIPEHSKSNNLPLPDIIGNHVGGALNNGQNK
jgi:hypothetical protein